MRQKIVAGNWKMNLDHDSANALFDQIVERVSNADSSLRFIVGSPNIYLKDFADRAKQISNLELAAQNCATHDSGAYTGEVSASMLKSIGVESVIIGHSERRSYYNEDNATLSLKVEQVLNNDLNLIFCCGENLDEREAGNHQAVVSKQLEDVLFKVDRAEFSKIIVAYEPVWAIGTGKTATPEQAQEMHQFIRSLIASKLGDDIANSIPLLYGGSCNDKNAPDLFANADIDGGLIGGASLDAEKFDAIGRSFPN